ncbi:hypothetical protein QUF74_06830 [Candidatus Halobeggiatoa sp. HSG11]|nr:hypothetical protein [Candidatus Halobeggiatoa sp. HSG11]
MKFWHWLLKNARLFPLTTGFIIFLILSIVTLLIGFGSTIMPEHPFFNDFFLIFNNSSVLMGWLSMTLAWSVALLAWAHREEAKHNFKYAGDKLSPIKDSFDASLILTSFHGTQTEWHIRNIEPKRIELVWTEKTREKAKEIFNMFEDIESIDSKNKNSGITNEQAYDIIIIKQHCISLLKSILEKYDKEKVCVDLTSGTAVMSIAAFQASEEMEVTSIYLRGETYNPKFGFIISDKKVSDPNEANVIILSDHRKK